MRSELRRRRLPHVEFDARSSSVFNFKLKRDGCAQGSHQTAFTVKRLDVVQCTPILGVIKLQRVVQSSPGLDQLSLQHTKLLPEARVGADSLARIPYEFVPVQVKCLMLTGRVAVGGWVGGSSPTLLLWWLEGGGRYAELRDMRFLTMR